MRKVNKKNCFSGGGTSYNPQTLQSPYLLTDFSKLLPTQLTAPASVQQYAPGNYNPGSSANPLFGSKALNLFGGVSAGIGQAGDAVSSMIGNITAPATAATRGEANMQTVTNTIGGAAKGAAAGLAVGGPVGAIVGGVAGLASGITGNKGKVNLSSNPYDDNITVNYGTGIRGGKRNRRKIERQRDQAIANARSNQASLAMGYLNELEFYQDYDTDIQTMAYGGTVSSLAYVDDGEVLNTPQGDIVNVPEEGKPTDSNLVNLPEGTRILSDKRKVPGSKETFAQMGKRLMSKRTSKAKDKYAENATMLNLMHDLMIYDRLFAIQEGTKKKQSVLKFADGGTKRGFRYRDELSGKEYFYGIGETFSYKGNKYRVNDRNLAVPIRDYSGFNTNMDPNMVDQVDNLLDLSGETVSRPNEVVIPKKSVKPRGTATTNSNVITPVENALDLSGETQARVPYETAPYISSTSSASTPVTPSSTVTSTPSNNWGSVMNLFTDIAALAPTISNMYTKPESFNAVYNPYEAQINQTMANRRFDISPAKRAIRENRAISNYNTANYNPNTGANLAYRIQSQVAANKAISDLYSTASNVNNQYKADYASTLNSLGQQRVNATNMAVDMNARSRAAARNIQRTALSQYAQNKQLMKNQKSRDMAMLEMYGPFLEAGYKASDYASFMKQFKKG
ncbi:hypothetical protein [uncultured phage cr52_1]|uniref:Uncharacterized protein n=1 Tax=uncultured phage cr52_1 TaxID=2772079 RepID=A0A7M1RS98_9CAUD|nr:hypothetical protein KNV46_gp32 [uncultured phage cr52_1]QOR56652.1 hypothetical protein [uncultured phage cr52_1]